MMYLQSAFTNSNLIGKKISSRMHRPLFYWEIREFHLFLPEPFLFCLRGPISLMLGLICLSRFLLVGPICLVNCPEFVVPTLLGLYVWAKPWSVSWRWRAGSARQCALVLPRQPDEIFSLQAPWTTPFYPYPTSFLLQHFHAKVYEFIILLGVNFYFPYVPNGWKSHTNGGIIVERKMHSASRLKQASKGLQ
jgi:hypothetical protein